MNMHETVISELELWKGRWPVIAEKTGISKRTIEKIARREIENPGVKHVEVLYAFFTSEAA